MSVLSEQHDAICDLPGSTPARRLLVSKGLEYLDKLARDAGDRPDLQRELANAYVKVGDALAAADAANVTARNDVAISFSKIGGDAGRGGP